MEPIRNILRHKKTAVQYYEARATKIDYERKVVAISDESEIQGDMSKTEVPFDLLVVGVGAENATFGWKALSMPLTKVGANVGFQQASPVSKNIPAS